MTRTALKKRITKLEEITPECDFSHVSDEDLERSLFLATKNAFGELPSEEMQEYKRLYQQMWNRELVVENKSIEECFDLLDEKRELIESSVEFTPELRSLLTKYMEI